MVLAAPVAPGCGRDARELPPRRYAVDDGEEHEFSIELPGIPPAEPGDVYPIQFVNVRHDRAPARVLTLAIVDDAPTPDAVQLRQYLEEEWQWRELHFARDPGELEPWTEDVLIVPSSSHASAHLIVSSDYAEARPKEDSEILTHYVTDTLASYADIGNSERKNLVAMDLAAHFLAELLGNAPDESSLRERLLSRRYDTILVRFATTRPDESLVDVEELRALAAELRVQQRFVHWSAHVYTTAVDDQLQYDAFLPKFSQLLGPGGISSLGWGDDFLATFRGAFTPMASCLPQVPVESNGRANCRAFRLFSEADTSQHNGGQVVCPEVFAWRRVSQDVAEAIRGHYENSLTWLNDEPDAVRKEVRKAISESHVCEVEQLRGPALLSCQSDFDCVDCEPGWCYTEEFYSLEALCSDTGSFVGSDGFRFVGGAKFGPVDNSKSVVICEIPL